MPELIQQLILETCCKQFIVPLITDEVPIRCKATSASPSLQSPLVFACCVPKSNGSSALAVHSTELRLTSGTTTDKIGTRGRYLATSLAVLPPRVSTKIRPARDVLAQLNRDFWVCTGSCLSLEHDIVDPIKDRIDANSRRSLGLGNKEDKYKFEDKYECDSTGDLYPVTAPSPIPHAFLVSQHTWHQRLGHPGGEVLRRLVSSNFISCNKEKPPILYHACQLGKHVRISFVSSCD
ncbi:ribonuclease H-like domain-containing protein [Tanacetum coccineum]